MHREFRKRLGQATGDSERIIALNVDVRGFSAFSERVESVEAALYIKKIYEKLLDGYFGEEASFFKPTGDGLLVVFGYDDDTLKGRSNWVVKTSLKLVREFPRLLTHDPAVNFKVPAKVGIGMARGAASRLCGSDDTTLDYSGRILNLASRLMDVARPEGVVFDSSFRPDVLTPGLRKRFKSEKVFVRGIAESTPLTIFVSDHVAVPAGLKRPITELEWETVRVPLHTVRDIFESPTFQVHLPSRVLDPTEIIVKCVRPRVMANGKKHPRHVLTMNLGADKIRYVDEADTQYVRLNFGDLVDAMVNEGQKGVWAVRVNVQYPKR
jgi:class 3 adenylate cyclase